MSKDNSDSVYDDWDRKNAIATYNWKIGKHDDKMEQNLKRVEMLYIILHKKQRKLEKLKRLYTKDDIQRISENYLRKKEEHHEEQVRFRQYLRELAQKFPGLKLPGNLEEFDEAASAGAADEGQPQE